MNNSWDYIYLHGFASSPQSAKAQYLQTEFIQSKNINLKIPDLNLDNFSDLTLTRQLQQVANLFNHQDVTLIGSSFGGLTAAWLGEKYPQIKRLILLAPAFGFLSHWQAKLGETQIQQWQESGYLSVYHYGLKDNFPLNYQFFVDLNGYQDEKLQKPIPTLIIHGIHDDVIPIQFSLDYAKSRQWVQLIQLNSDHSLTNCLSEISLAIEDFLSS